MSNVDSTPPAWEATPVTQMQPPLPQAPQGGRTNTLAIVAFVGSFFVSLLGIIGGHIALRQIKRSGEKGHGFALAATIIGYVSLVLTAILVTVVVVLGASLAKSVESAVGPQVSTNGNYTDAFCHDLFGIAQSAQAAANDPDQVEGLKQAYATVANDPSPHQKEYQAMADLLANPGGASADQVKAVTKELGQAAATDARACATRLK